VEDQVRAGQRAWNEERVGGGPGVDGYFLVVGALKEGVISAGRCAAVSFDARAGRVSPLRDVGRVVEVKVVNAILAVEEKRAGGNDAVGGQAVAAQVWRVIAGAAVDRQWDVGFVLVDREGVVPVAALDSGILKIAGVAHAGGAESKDV